MGVQAGVPVFMIYLQLITLENACGIFIPSETLDLNELYRLPDRSARECEYWWFDAWDWLANRAIQLAGSPEVEVSPGEVAIDPHVHTLFSHCSILRPDRVISRAIALGLSGVAVMDHHTTRGALDTMRCAQDLKHRRLIPEDFLVIPGAELNSTLGHIGALFVEEDLPENLSPEETVRVIHEAGGLAVAVHPYHLTGICDAVFDAPFDAVETECGSVFDTGLAEQNANLVSDPRLAGAAKLGSSDAHYLYAIGTCYSALTLETPTLEAARRAITSKHCVAKSSAPCRRFRKLLGRVKKLK